MLADAAHILAITAGTELARSDPRSSRVWSPALRVLQIVSHGITLNVTSTEPINLDGWLPEFAFDDINALKEVFQAIDTVTR